MKKAVRLLISGNVQGVLFRRFVKDSANKNGVTGFVRNLEDGRVEVFLEGNPEEVDKMVLICNKGPAYSYTRQVEQKEEKLQDFKDFKIL